MRPEGGEFTVDELDALDSISEQGWKVPGVGAASGPVSELERPAEPVVGTAPGGRRPSPADMKALVDQEGPSVRSWRVAPREAIEEQWRDLREFVEWVADVYQLETGEHKPCWWRHPWIVQEWLGLWHLHRLSWSEEDSGAGPNNFNYWLAAGRSRLAGAWAKTTCGRMHAVPRRPMEEFTVIDDAEWQGLVGGAADAYLAPSQWPSWRDVDEDASGIEGGTV